MINFLDLVVRKRCHLAHQGGTTIVFRIGFRTIIFSNRMFDSNGSDTGYTGKPRLYYIVNGLPIFVRVSGNGNAISPFLLPPCAASIGQLLRGNGNAIHLMSAGPLSFCFCLQPRLGP